MTKKSKKLGVKTSKSTVFDECEEAVPEGENVKSVKTETDNELYKNVCETLDHLHLDLLILMRKTMQDKLKIEKCMTDGELNLSKSRYIMGHKNVSTLQLPTELSADIDPSLTLEEVKDETMFGQPRLNLLTEEFTNTNKNKKDDNDDAKNIKDDNDDAKNIQDPTKWFGVLVPRNLKAAQSSYKEAVSWVVDCANNQIKIHQICVKIKQLTQMKKDLNKPKNEE